MKHKIGEIYEVNGGKYKLVKGDSCASCYLRNKDEICQMMPPCEQHKGHYVKVDAGEKVVLNLPDVSQQRELFYNFITWYNAKPFVKKPKDGLITTTIIEEYLKL